MTSLYYIRVTGNFNGLKEKSQFNVQLISSVYSRLA